MSQKKSLKSFKLNKGLYLIDVDKYIDKSKKFLWEKKQKKFFFSWIFVFLVAMLCILFLNIAIIIGQCVDKQRILEFFSSPQIMNINPETTWSTLLAYNVVDTAISAIVVVNLSFSIYKCINLKSLKYISFLATIFVFIQMIYGCFSWIQYIIQAQQIAEYFKVSWIYVLNFIMPFLYIFVWFFISRNISLIRNIFIRVETREILMKQAELNQESNPFTPNNFGGFENTKSTNSDISKETNPFYKRLKNLSREQLNEMAQALSISGYETMKDQEIIDIIYEIKHSQEQNSKEIEVESQQKEKEEESQK